jgi:CubicO group peptidase (beta-lactamase class C family)
MVMSPNRLKNPTRRQAMQALCAAPLLLAPRLARAASFTNEQRLAVEDILKREVDTGVAPGICWSIGTASETLAEGAVGLKLVSPQTPMGAATRFALASVTKQFTAAALYLLQQKGVVSLDAPLADYLPSYRYAADLNLRQILTMTSGITADMACEDPVDVVWMGTRCSNVSTRWLWPPGPANTSATAIAPTTSPV